MLRRILLLPLLPLALLLAIWVLHPWPLPLRWVNPTSSAYMEHRVSQARASGETLALQHRWVPLEDFPPHLVRAVLVAEDDRFRDHGGIDWEALAEEVRYRGSIPPDLRDPAERERLGDAWRHVRENRDQVRGRSTLTQQLARNLYLSPDRSFIRKGQEFLITRRLEFFLSKDRILELYLNLAEFGPGIFGVGAAAEHYFGVEASALTRHQAASLAATLPHPLTSNPGSNPGRMAWRRDLILNRLAGGGAPVPAAPVSPPDPVLDPVIDPDTAGDASADTVADTIPDPVADTVADIATDTVADTAGVTAADTAGVTAADTAGVTAADTAGVTAADTAAGSDTIPDPDSLIRVDPDSVGAADRVAPTDSVSHSNRAGSR